jgi:hypothetical protein
VTEALDRDALYYPYLEIQSVNWLKATLLCFPHVRRIVPGGYHPDDVAAIKPFLETKGIGDLPLLSNEAPVGDSCFAEQERLAEKIRDAADLFRRKFSRAAAQNQYPAGWSQYRIYYLKLHGPLRDTLLDLGLAWEDESEWYSLHPRLGRAVMATIAIALANDKGLDIVTGHDTTHRSVCTQEQSDVFDELVGTLRHGPPRPSPEVVDELAGVFMSTYFDLSRLSAPQIAELQKDGKDLRQFKDAVREVAQRIPDIPNAAERRRRLTAEAKEIYSRWRKYRKSLPKFAFDALFEAGDVKVPAGVAAALGAAFLPFGLAAGIAVGFVAYAGVRVWRKYRAGVQSPYQYLNRIHKKGGTLVVPTAVKTK